MQFIPRTFRTSSLLVRRLAVAACVAGAFILTISLLVLGGCKVNPPSNEPGKDKSSLLAAELRKAPGYLGSDACRECHQKEFVSHQTARHASTMRLATPAGLGPDFPKAGRIGDSNYSFDEHGGDYYLITNRQPPYGVLMKYALGAGKSGLTFVTPRDDGSLTEGHMSYFPSLRAWHVNPGQPEDIHGEVGIIKSAADSRRCIGCHSTFLPEQIKKVDPEPRFLGVGCESCHGPASRHVAAVRSGNRVEGRMRKLADLSPRELNTLCGKCHRNPVDVTPGHLSTLTHRFQSYAIMKSACFTKSKGNLSCLSCHNPHENASADVTKYDQVCLSCHSTPKGKDIAIHQTEHLSPVRSRICPVNSTSGCINCHMERRLAFRNRKIPTTMRDHLIRVPLNQRAKLNRGRQGELARSG